MMSSYNNFIGIDIGKFNFVVATTHSKNTHEYENNDPGIHTFITEFKKELKHSLCILETTGGYEMTLLLTLCHQGFAVHRANTRHVKNFIRSYGNSAKTDRLDAKALASYGTERAHKLDKFVPPSAKAFQLYELVQRRQDLKQMLVAEKNRLSAPRLKCVKESCHSMIKALNAQIETITTEIDTLIKSEPALSKMKEILKTIPGIGPIIANELLVLLPELGKLNRRQIASLSGLAPKANDSGQFKGYRSLAPGRRTIKPLLFLAAMAARNSNSPLRAFYDNLINKGKKKMVALTALMRKIIVIANAKIKEYLLMPQHS